MIVFAKICLKIIISNYFGYLYNKYTFLYQSYTYSCFDVPPHVTDSEILIVSFFIRNIFLLKKVCCTSLFPIHLFTMLFVLMFQTKKERLALTYVRLMILSFSIPNILFD